MGGWVGCDLDGTLATYDTWRGEDHIGEPIAPMVERIKQHLADGYEVRIFTARVSLTGHSAEGVMRTQSIIRAWCREHVGVELDVVCEKDYGMIFLYDDRCCAVEKNTGRLLSPVPKL